MEIGVCSQCGKRTYIQNKTRCLCADCVYKNNHDGKTRIEVAIEQRRKRLQNPHKPTKNPRKSHGRKVTGERAMFLKIWQNRPHYCTNCGKYLGEEPCSWMFSHREAKGANENLRLCAENIDLLCFDCHFARDMQGEEIFKKRGGKV